MKYEVELTDEQAREVDEEFYLDEHKRPRSPLDDACYALADAIRANPPKPPRMDEPGWGGRVTAHIANAEPRTYIRAYASLRRSWTDGYQFWYWDDLIDPEPVTL